MFLCEETFVTQQPPKDTATATPDASAQPGQPPTPVTSALSQEDEDRIMRFIEKHRKLLEKLA